MAHLKDYRPDIDGLRAIAVLSVVIFHAFPNGPLKGGFTGVDVFFVISGYLISRIIINDLISGTYSTLGFYRRRVLRIFPALVTVLAACLAAGWMALLPDEFLQLAKHAFGSGAFVVNFMLWSEIGYFDSAADLKPLLHLWSLGIEEQFYIAWPLLLLSVYKVRGNLLKWALIVAAASFSYSIYCLFFDRSAAFYNPAARTWELASGAMAAMLVQNGFQPRKQWHADAISVLGLALIITGFFAVKQSGSFPGFKALLPVIGACLVILAGRAGLMNRTVLSSKPAIWIGLISYPLYLWHWPILSFLRIGQADGTYQDVTSEMRSVAVVLAIILAWATYVFIEKPIRFGAKRKQSAKVLVPAMMSVMAFSFYVYSQEGIPDRIAMHPQSAHVLFADYPHPSSNKDCRKNYPQLSDAWCLLSKDRPAEIAIVGDSHANQYYLSLAKQLPDLSVLNVSQPGCLPFSALDGCEQKVSTALQAVLSSPQIKTVIFTGYFSYLEADFKFGNVEGRRLAAEATPEKVKKFSAVANKSISAVLNSGRELIVLDDIPDLVFKPRDCVIFENPLMSFLRGTSATRPLDQCGIKSSDFQRRLRAHQERLDAIIALYPRVKRYDPKPHLCDGELCRAYSAGEFDYWNSDHLTIVGADKVIAGLINKHGGSVFPRVEPIANAN